MINILTMGTFFFLGGGGGGGRSYQFGDVLTWARFD